MHDGQCLIASQLRSQAEWCRKLESPLYNSLLLAAAQDAESGGPTWHLLERYVVAESSQPVGLRLMAAVHHLVLDGQADEVARFFPSVGGDSSAPGASQAFVELLEDQIEAIRIMLENPSRPNEVARCAALLGGFLLTAETGRPLSLLELGASAGLNLLWDKYSYKAGDAHWGNPQSPVRICNTFLGRTPNLKIHPEVIQRSGCDQEPIDLCCPAGRNTLLSHVWADHLGRWNLAKSAVELANQVPVQVEKASPVEWLSRKLKEQTAGNAVVIFHSMYCQDLDEVVRRELLRVIESAGGTATARTPVAWMRMEADGPCAIVRLKTWPKGEDQVIATSGYYGRPVNWLAY